MAQLLQNNQKQYVPLSSDKKKTLLPVHLHGDELFEERLHNVKWTFQDGESSFERLEGLEPEFADWHAKFTLYKVNGTTSFILAMTFLYNNSGTAYCRLVNFILDHSTQHCFIS